MPKDPIITIPATSEATSEYRKAQSKANLERENVREVTFGTNNLKSTVFKRGIKLDPEQCFMTTPLDGWAPTEQSRSLSERVPDKTKAKVDKEFSPTGLVSFIAITDTTSGVRERIEYDENESIVMEEMNHEPPPSE